MPTISPTCPRRSSRPTTLASTCSRSDSRSDVDPYQFDTDPGILDRPREIYQTFKNFFPITIYMLHNTNYYAMCFSIFVDVSFVDFG